jgi:8-oxo-dGTP diphosphatase
MPSTYCYDHPRPAVTVDLVVFTLIKGKPRVLLVKRKSPPFEGRWAIPGGFLDIDEPVEDGARRELREETGLQLPGSVEFLGVFADPGRDPRGRTISLAHAAWVHDPGPIEGGDDASEAAWHDPEAKLELAFDHAAILGRAREWFRSKHAG